MADLNIIERANKVLTFRKYIREECRKKGMDYPSDEKLAEYINETSSFDVAECMKAYEGKLGVFHDPFDDLIKEIGKISWGDNKPSEELIRDYASKNGCDINGFLKMWNINSYKGVEKDTLLATLKLDDTKLVALWNKFIEESALYGADSYIYDLKFKDDVEYINSNFPKEKIAEITRIIRNATLHGEEVRFIQWFSLNDKDDEKIRVKKDIKSIIIAYWGEIFERVMVYPSAYSFSTNLYAEGDGSTYFDDVFFPIIAKEIGYNINGDKGTIEKIEK